MKRKLIIALALCLALALGIGGTMAYLTATTTAVVNTFTIGNVGLKLVETENGAEVTAKSYKIVPGETVTKDPTVTVTTGSEPCWLFVKITEDLGALSGAGIDDFFSYAPAAGWTKLTGIAGVDNVYYRTVGVEAADSAIGSSIPVLAGNTAYPNGVVTLSDKITQSMSEVLADADADKPTLTFKAAAVQYANIADVQTAYNNLPDAFKG